MMYSPACTRDTEWWHQYVLVSLVSFFGGLVILVPARIIWYFCRGSRSSPYNDLSDEEEEMDGSSSRACFSFRRMRAAAHELQSGNQIFSKIYVFLMFASNMGSVLIYLVDATLYVLDCSADTVIRGNTIQLVWLGLSAIQAVDYIVRFIAATDKLYVWLTLYSVVDHFTIVPAFYGYFINRNWIGLRFLRLTYLLQIPDVLQVMHILKTHFKIRFVQCVSVFTAVWLASSGFIHLCENSGDPHHDYSNGQNLTYWTTVYYTLVTMSTVGYGDYSPKTDIGKAFIVVYIIGSFAMFSSIVPELAQTFGNRSRYKKPFKRTYGKKHVIVCGHLAYESVCNFVRNFVHKDAESSNTSLVFVDRKKPTLELEAYFRRHSNDIVFYEGTIMNPQTLRNVKIESADACIILANRHTKDPDDEDAANIMRAAAVKTYCPRIRIIMQLLKVQSKKHLLNVPSWKWDKIDGDNAICLTDLKLSIMAQNCLTPGFSTLLSNLVINRSYTRSNEPDWTSYYRFGAGHEIYAEPLPESFVGMRFPDVAEICFLYANALLVGVDVSGDGARMALKLNPGKDTIIESGYIGYFIAQSLEDVRKAYRQRSARFEELKAEKAKGLTSTSFNGDKTSTPSAALVPLLSDIDNYATITASQATIRKLKAEHSTSVQIDSLLKSPPDFEMRPMGKPRQSDEVHNVDVDSNSMFDVTGNFHWCQRKAMSECIISRSEAHQHIFKRHIVACVIAKVDTPPMGLFSFIMPLRASNYLYRELKPVIIIGDVNYIEKEWSKLEHFPLIYVFNGDPLERADLDAVSINKCDMCVVLSSTVNSILVDETMLDREVLLATLNIRSMYDRSFEERKRSISAICFSGMSHGNEYWTRDFAASREIPLTTVLESESSVAFLDAEHDNPDLPLYRTKLYMSGKVFATSTLDSLLSSTYLNGHVLNLFRALSAGAQVDEFEQILATASGITQSHAEHDINNVRNRCRLVQLGLLNGPLEKIKHQDNYGQLLTQALHTYGILCLGVFRLIDPSEKNVRRRRRFVITNPAGNFKLLLSDLIFALQPFPYAEVTITKSSSVGRFNVESSEQCM